jgi:hypothetical protein
MKPDSLTCCARAQGVAYLLIFIVLLIDVQLKPRLAVVMLCLCRHQSVICISLNTMKFLHFDFDVRFRLFVFGHYSLDYT